MANLILPSRFTRQPQGAVEVDYGYVSGQIIIASRPGVQLYDPASQLTPSILGTAPTADYRRVTQEGMAVEVHPNGGASGIGVLAWPTETIPNTTSELTLIWVGTPKNLSTANGFAFARGHDGGGGGWSISAIFASSTSLTFNVVSLTPTAGYTATITDSFSITQPERIAYRLSGGVLTGFHHRSRKSSSTAIGANLRGNADSLLRLGGHNSTLTGGHNISNGFIAIRGSLSDAEIWELLDNPWQIFRKRPQILYFDAATGGATDLTIADSTHGHAAENAVLTSSHLLTVADATHAHSADNVALAQNSTIIVLDSTHAHTAEVSTVTETSSAPLTVLDSTHGHTAEVVAISTQTSVTVLDATHGHTADVVVTNTQTTAVVQDSTHGHTADTVGVTQQSEDETALTVLDSTHGHTAETVTLTTATSLIVLDSTHGHTAETSTVAQQGETSLTALDATHAHAADNARLTLSADQVAPATGGGGGWPFQVPYLKSELEKLDKKSAKRKTEKAKLPKPVRDSLLEAIAQTLPEPIKAPEPVIAIRPTEVAKPAPVAIKQPPAQDLSADIAQLAKSIQIMQGQIMELTQATIAMQLQLQEGLENIEALTLIGATIGDL